MTNQVRSQPSPGPCWETLSVPLDTPDASDVEDTGIVELELLGTPRKRKEKANDISNDAKRARYKVSQGRRGSNEFNPPSGIQVTSRQHPSPSITRTGRGIEIHSVPESSKRTNGAGGIAGGNSGHCRDRAIISTSGIATDRRNAVSVTEPGQTISRPNIARKRTARKYATDVFKNSQSISAPSAVTRPIQRTREEKKRQNSISSSSDSLPYSPTAPVKILNGDKIADKRTQKAAHSIGSSQPTQSVGPRKSAVPRRTTVIDITSDGESASFSRAGKRASHDVLVIDSSDESTPKHHNNAKASPISRRPAPTTQATSKQVIEIIDSDEEPISSSKIDSFEEDTSLPQGIQDESMDELDRLSLLAEQSPQDGGLIPPPESSPESSESVVHSVRESSSDSGGSEKECLSPLIMSINDDGKVDMDIDFIIPAFQADKGGFEQAQSDILPAFQCSASPPNRIHIPSPRSLSPQSVIPSKPLEKEGLGVPVSPESPSHGGDSNSSMQRVELVQKWPSVRADLNSSDIIPQRRKRLSHDEAGIHRTQVTNNSVSTKRSHPGRNMSLSSLPVANPHDKTELGVPKLSPGMNLADAIMQASQANRTHVRNHLRTETVSEATGKPIDHGEGIQKSIEESRLFMRMLQNTQKKKQQQSDLGVMKKASVIDYHSVPNHLAQRTGDPVVDSGSSANSRQSSSESGVLTSPKIRPQHSPIVESSLAILGNADRSNAESSTEDIPVQESDDELEYIDETDVVQNLANIDITNQVTSDEEVVDDHLNFLEPTPKDAVQPAHGSITRASSPDPMNMFDTTADGEETIPPSTLPSSRKSTPHEATHSEIPATIKVEGFNILNWRDFRQDLSNFAPNHYLAKDLPHALQDHINHMSEWTRSLPDMRVVFTAAIQENTALDEPDAPRIQLENFIDDEPTPPWEFHYSNQMWHGEGVPPPDIKNLVSCDCIGRCDPRSKTCACVRRQREAFEDPNADFAYDNKGRLKELGYPIFECNDLCGCDDDCRNRVVQHGRTYAISIRKTANKGWGVFVDQKKIYKGTFIGIYAGELITDEAGEERGFKYDKLGKTYLFDIDFHHLHKDHKDWTSKYTVDAYHAGNFTRFLNHSCDPNCTLNPCYINEGNIDKPLLAVFARRDIEPGEELCFSYFGDPDEDDNMDASDDTGGIKNDAVYAKCYCGAKNCKGRFFC